MRQKWQQLRKSRSRLRTWRIILTLKRTVWTIVETLWWKVVEIIRENPTKERTWRWKSQMVNEIHPFTPKLVHARRRSLSVKSRWERDFWRSCPDRPTMCWHVGSTRVLMQYLYILDSYSAVMLFKQYEHWNVYIMTLRCYTTWLNGIGAFAYWRLQEMQTP